jgi:P-type E1-E2 ATPase
MYLQLDIFVSYH